MLQLFSPCGPLLNLSTCPKIPLTNVTVSGWYSELQQLGPRHGPILLGRSLANLRVYIVPSVVLVCATEENNSLCNLWLNRNRVHRLLKCVFALHWLLLVARYVPWLRNKLPQLPMTGQQFLCSSIRFVLVLMVTLWECRTCSRLPISSQGPCNDTGLILFNLVTKVSRLFCAYGTVLVN